MAKGMSRAVSRFLKLRDESFQKSVDEELPPPPTKSAVIKAAGGKTVRMPTSKGWHALFKVKVEVPRLPEGPFDHDLALLEDSLRHLPDAV